MLVVFEQIAGVGARILLAAVGVWFVAEIRLARPAWRVRPTSFERLAGPVILGFSGVFVGLQIGKELWR